MNAYESLQQRSREIALYNSAASLLSWDQETYMPAKAGAYRAEQLSQLAGLTHQLGTSSDVGDWIKACEDSLPPCADEAATALRAANVREWRRDYDRATKLPARLVEDIARTTSLAREEWAQARRDSAFASFAPWLEKILGLVREQADCWGYSTCAYDALLEGYEPGARAAELSPVFADLQKQLTPLLPRAAKNHRRDRSRQVSRAITRCLATAGISIASGRATPWASISRRAGSIPRCIRFAPRWVRGIAA